SGTFSASFTIPANAVQTLYTITAADSSRTASTTLNVSTATGTAGVTLINTPSAAAPNQVIGLTGTGYTAGSVVTITGLGNSSTTVASATGAITTTITVPSNQANGNVTLTATDSASRFATAVERSGVAGISLILNPASGLVGSSPAIAGTGFRAGEQMLVSLAQPGTLPTAIAGTTVSYTADANGNFSGTFPVPNQPAGNYVVLALGATSRIMATTAFAVNAAAATASPSPTASGTPGVVPFPTPPVVPTPVTGPLASVSTSATTTYFAEGFTGTAAGTKKATFTEKLYLFNPGSAASNVTTSYYVYDTAHNTHNVVTAHDTVAPGATVVRNVNSDAGNDREVSIIVQASAGISAETVISRVAVDGTVLDTGSSKGSTALGQTWYLAEGYTGASLQEYLLLFNPGNTPAKTQIQYLPSDTAAPPAQSVTIPANGRVTINVRSAYNGLIKQGSRNIGISVTSDQPIAVDRSLYWGDGAGSGKYGYSLGSAISAGKSLQYFSFLPTSNGSQSFVTVLNPTGNSATVTLSLRDAIGSSIRDVSATVGAGRRYTFSLNQLLSGNYGAISGSLSSSVPVVAEAGLYFGGSPNIGRHPGLVVQGAAGASVGSRANVNAAGALLRIVNTSGNVIRIQVSAAGNGGSTVLNDSTLASKASRVVQVPAGTDPRSILVLGSGSYTATVVNGGDASSTAWGGNLN
ncbi:MAG: apr 2, partial [Chloroflexi bacterium]|nr:apr 2 [Chloroflexota bacterium]